MLTVATVDFVFDEVGSSSLVLGVNEKSVPLSTGALFQSDLFESESFLIVSSAF